MTLIVALNDFRIRKSLTSQLHLLRQELGPKEEKLLQSSERLHEVEREYERAIYAISEKEHSLSRKGESLHLLQKQVYFVRPFLLLNIYN